MTGTNPLHKMRAIKQSVGSDRVYIALGSIGRFRKYGEVYEENLEPTSSHTLCSVQEGKGWGAGCGYFCYGLTSLMRVESWDSNIIYLGLIIYRRVSTASGKKPSSKGGFLFSFLKIPSSTSLICLPLNHFLMKKCELNQGSHEEKNISSLFIYSYSKRILPNSMKVYSFQIEQLLKHETHILAENINGGI